MPGVTKDTTGDGHVAQVMPGVTKDTTGDGHVALGAWCLVSPKIPQVMVWCHQSSTPSLVPGVTKDTTGDGHVALGACAWCHQRYHR